MNVRLSLEHRLARWTMMAAVLTLCGCLLVIVSFNFVVDALSDERIPVTVAASPASFITAPFTDQRIGVNPSLLAAAVRYLPNSSRLQLRLAVFESGQFKEDWNSDESHALRAIRLSPHDYRPRLLLASIQESKENFQAAEETVRTVLKLAPNSLEGRWQLATLLLRKKELPEAFEAFLAAGSGDLSYFRAALEMVWSESGERTDAMMAITPDNLKCRLALAGFLLQKSRPLDSAAVFRQIGHDALLDDQESGLYLDNLIAAGHIGLAYDLWRVLAARSGEADETTNPISNSGFESDILLNISQFDWSIGPSAYARISIDSSLNGVKTAHGGVRSLRIDFLGRETTRLEKEIKHLAVVRPGMRYRLRYFVKSENLVAPAAPRVVLSSPTSQDWIASSDPAPLGSSDWQQQTVEFTARDSALIVAIEQRPRFSYEDPTIGTVWFDDFEIQEIHAR
jgi:tetratricopeptide (TPR) repeat protein